MAHYKTNFEGRPNYQLFDVYVLGDILIFVSIKLAQTHVGCDHNWSCIFRFDRCDKLGQKFEKVLM
jgi:hypothetical protein